MIDSLPQKLLDKIQFSEDCWEWTGALTHNGYSKFYWNGKTHRGHRTIFELEREPIPEGMALDHLCRNRSCVNPDHLEIVTVAENVRRGKSVSQLNKRKSHCNQGHPLSGDNLYVWQGDGSRRCRTCQGWTGLTKEPT